MAVRYWIEWIDHSTNDRHTTDLHDTKEEGHTLSQSRCTPHMMNQWRDKTMLKLLGDLLAVIAIFVMGYFGLVAAYVMGG